jgi:hypothetical protein
VRSRGHDDPDFGQCSERQRLGDAVALRIVHTVLADLGEDQVVFDEFCNGSDPHHVADLVDRLDHRSITNSDGFEVDEHCCGIAAADPLFSGRPAEYL